ncbi:MAG: phosphatidylserine decarboxylase family protein [Deltaproteobacteria bacterium]|nr:MAG: phosphatidylserine decarboxylase family protein [Deltaproteobacteria bacterium]
MRTTETDKFAREGRAVLGIAFVFFLFSLTQHWWVASGIFLLFLAFSLYFFRNPSRQPRGDETDVLSPADGKVVQNEIVDDDRYLKTKCRKIGIFMSLFDVHVNRVPVSGSVQAIEYHPGKFVSANLDKASQDNEQNALIIKTKNGIHIAVVQIAGLIARRIVCYPVIGTEIERGTIFGMIKFGSRLDVYLPENSTAHVKLGEKVHAGETIIASLPEEDKT